jgi:hypothetical protein
MSHGYRHPIRVVAPTRPRGLALLATIGVLAGLAQLILVLLIAWIRLRRGIPLGNQLAPLGLGIGLAWVIVWLNWGLWDLVRWAWWGSVIFGSAAVIGCGLLFRSVPDLAALLSRGLPEELAQRLELGLTVELIFLLIFHVVMVIYLLMIHKVFGIGLKQKRPLWERQ